MRWFAVASAAALILIAACLLLVDRPGRSSNSTLKVGTSAVRKPPYVVKPPRMRPGLCDASGRCREDAAVPHPRGEFSARSPEQLTGWHETHKHLVEQSTKMFAEGAPPVDVMFVGDSITEFLTGLSLNRPCCEGQAAAFSEAWAGKVVFASGISGDQTQHLLYRLATDELPPDAPVAAIVVLIGTNNLGAGMKPEDAARGVVAVVEAVRVRVPGARVYVEELFPRGRIQGKVAATNALVREAVGGMDGEGLRLMKCGALLAQNSADKEEEDWVPDPKLMPDALHPSGEGVALWMKCVRENGVI